MEHPQVTYINRTGYPEDMQEAHWGCDWKGDEILIGELSVRIRKNLNSCN